MRIVKSLGALVLASVALFAAGDDHTPPPFFPIETYSCSYNENKALSDMLTTAKKWNKWTTKEIPETGFAAVLTPYLADRSAVSSDVFWVNMAPNFEAMGSVQDQWVAKGSKLAAEFDEVCRNDSHSMFAGQMVRRPAEEGPQSGYIGFESCSLKEGASMQKMLAADAKYVETQASIGNTGMTMRWWPMAGVSPQMEGDFYLVSGVDSMQSLGQNVDRSIANMTGEPDPYDDLVECSGRTVFAWQSVRSPD
jgi:hypothetical protein